MSILGAPNRGYKTRYFISKLQCLDVQIQAKFRTFGPPPVTTAQLMLHSLDHEMLQNSNFRYRVWVPLFNALFLSNIRTEHHYKLQREHKKYPPATFVDISAMRGDFCMKSYRTVKQSNIHFITKFGWNLLESDKLMLFQPRQPLHFLSLIHI